MKKMLAILSLIPMAAMAATIERENSWVIPDLMFMDQDGDGIADQNDQCASTAVGKIVGADGCQLPVERVGDNQLQIKFDFNQSVVNTRYIPDLQGFAQILKANPEVSIELSGHTDMIGTDEYNQALSERRAQAVAQILINQFEVPSRQLDIVGYSEARPLIVGDAEDARAQNRRVQAQLIDYNQGEQFLKTQASD